MDITIKQPLVTFRNKEIILSDKGTTSVADVAPFLRTFHALHQFVLATARCRVSFVH